MEYTEEQREAYKAMRKFITKAEKVLKNLPKGNLVQECLDNIQKYWNHPVRDRWIVNLAHNATSEYFGVNEVKGMNNKQLGRLVTESEAIKDKILNLQ